MECLESIKLYISCFFVIENTQYTIMAQITQQSSILRSLLQGHSQSNQAPHHNSNLVPTPECLVTSSSVKTPRACIGTLWRDQYRRTYHRQFDLVSTPEGVVTSSSEIPRACCGTWWQAGKHFQHHLYRDHYYNDGYINKDSDVSSSSQVISTGQVINEGNMHVTSSSDSSLEDFGYVYIRTDPLPLEDTEVSSSSDCY